MLKTDGDSLQCDLMETYSILDMYQHSPKRIAVFAYGLGNDSRIKRKITGTRTTLSEALLALIADLLEMELWRFAKKGTKRPASVYEALTKEPEPVESPQGFSTAEEFERKLKDLRG